MDSGEKHILVVEDDSAMANVLQFKLQQAGMRVTVANNGRVALDRIRKEHFDRVVTDHQMPEMTGCEFCEQLRSTSGYSNYGDLLQAIQSRGSPPRSTELLNRNG